MINTNFLTNIIDATMKDGRLIHASVKKVDKEPLSISIEPYNIHTHDDDADLWIVMHWDKRRFDPASGRPLEWSPPLRLKWFLSIVRILNERGAAYGIAFDLGQDVFDFGFDDKTVWGRLYVDVITVPRPAPAQTPTDAS